MSVITSTVGGPFLTSNVPSSIRVLVSPLTGSLAIFISLINYMNMCILYTKINMKSTYYLPNPEKLNSHYLK